MHGSRRFACWLWFCLVPGHAAFGAVDVRGVRGDLRDNVLSHLAVDDAPCDAPSWRVTRLNRKAAGEVREALEAYGYYAPSITIEPGLAADCWLTVVDIDPGEPVRIRATDVTVSGEAADDPAFARLVRASPLKNGDVLVHATYDRYKRSFADLARQKGYFAGTFAVGRIDVYALENAADITLRYESGPRYRFGPVSFEQSVVRKELVERFVDFRPGDAYDGLKVNDFYNALLATGYFSMVDLRTQPGTLPDNSVPVTLQLAPAKPKVYTVGTGFSTDTGVKLRAGYTNRRLNERGHQFDANLSLSEVLSEAGVSYRLPRRDPRVEWLSLDAGYSYEDTQGKTTQIYKVGAKEFRRRSNDWIETRFVDTGIERFDIADERQREFLLIPGISWNRTRPGNAAVTRPDKGHRLTVKLSGTAGLLGSDSEFLQTDLFAKFILPTWQGGRVLMRGEAGMTLKDEFRTLPLSVRYFAGGDYSVRGYDYDTLSPTDSAGNVIGGTHKLAGSIEIDQRVWRNWSVAAFVDSGNAFDSFSSVSAKTGIGAGVRWYSPLGPVRVDLAFPQDKNAPDDWRVHVTLGPDL